MMKILVTATVATALIAGLSSAQAAKQYTGKGRYCVEQVSGSFDMYCNFATLAACRKQAQPQFLQCQPNPRYGTTGSKTR
jgi:hypothetical protein